MWEDAGEVMCGKMNVGSDAEAGNMKDEKMSVEDVRGKGDYVEFGVGGI